MDLIQGMFGHEFDNKSPCFGIRCGQMRSRDFVHNGGWFNKQGEKLGWGDLSTDDMLRIAIEIKEGDYFVILSESDSFWRFVEKVGVIGSMSTTNPTVENPGVEYVADKAMYIIGHCQLIIVNDWEKNPERTRLLRDCVFPFDQINRDEVKLLLAHGLAN